MSDTIDQNERDKVSQAFQAAVSKLNECESIRQAIQTSADAQPQLDEADTALIEETQKLPYPHSVMIANAHLSQDALDAKEELKPSVRQFLQTALAEHEKAQPFWIQVISLLIELRKVEPHIMESVLTLLDELRKAEPDTSALQEFQSHLEQMNNISTGNM